MSIVLSGEGHAFFVDGPGGTVKTFLYRSLMATVRKNGHIAIAVATSGVAAAILPGGRTAHSRFKIPIDLTVTLCCQLSKQSSAACLIVDAKIIIWDEASMAKKEAIEAFDMLLKDLMGNEEAFGGKIVVFGGDFCQTLPVIEKSSRDTQVTACIVTSFLWKSMKVMPPTENMRALLDPAFCTFLLRIREGIETCDENGNISLPEEIVIPFTDMEASLDRCSLCPKNSSVDDVNDMLIKRFPGEMVAYTSVDKTVDKRHQRDYKDFLNSLNPKSLPPHKLLLKENCPVILLRNLNPVEGLCNGTRLICKKLTLYTILAEIATGQHARKEVFILGIPLQCSDGDKHGIPFIRTQFSVRLCFLMTINKAQGQTLDSVASICKSPFSRMDSCTWLCQEQEHQSA